MEDKVVRRIRQMCQVIEALGQELQEARAENKRLREALAWYVGKSAESLMWDGGRHAAEALSKGTDDANHRT